MNVLSATGTNRSFPAESKNAAEVFEVPKSMPSTGARGATGRPYLASLTTSVIRLRTHWRRPASAHISHTQCCLALVNEAPPRAAAPSPSPERGEAADDDGLRGAASIGTMSLVSDSGLGLPMESTFGEDLAWRC